MASFGDAACVAAHESCEPGDGLDVELAVEHLIADYERRIARGRLNIFDVDATAVSRSVEFAILNEDGDLVLDGWSLLGDACRERLGYPGIMVRRLDFSVLIPAEIRSFSLYARYADDGEVIACSHFDQARVDELCSQWDEGHVAAGLDGRYEEWFLTRHRSGERELALQRDSWQGLAEQPTFSVIVPLFRTSIAYLNEMAASVLAQTYPKLELVLVNASPELAGLASEVAKLAAADSRVRVVALDSNLGITENTNAGIRAATGDFLAFCDHDDAIEPDALFWYAKAVNDHPETDLLYCDEDYLNGERHQWPNLKPDWDIDLLCSMNYVCHMLCVRRSIVEGLPKLPGKEFDGAQDHNMTFLVGERARNVYHVRRILYHWRMHEGSTAGEQGVDQKSYAIEAERRAVQGHLDRMGIKAIARMGYRQAPRAPFDRCYVDFAVPDPAEQPVISIVIPSHEASDLLRACVESIYEKTTWQAFEVVVVENGSRDPATFALYDELAAAHPSFRVVECEQPDGFNFSLLANRGADASRGEYVLLLNNDTEVISPDWLEQMMGPMADSQMGVVGAKLLYPDDTVQHVGVAVGRSYGPFHVEPMKPAEDPCYYECAVLPHQAMAVTGACLLTRKELYDRLGGLDESFPVDYNDIDYCLRVREAGYRVLEQPRALLRHRESVSRGEGDPASILASRVSSLGRFHARWGHYLSYGDPFYNKNFRFNNPYHMLDF